METAHSSKPKIPKSSFASPQLAIYTVVLCVAVSGVRLFSVSVDANLQETYVDCNHKSCFVESRLPRESYLDCACQKVRALLIPRRLVGATNLIHLHTVKKMSLPYQVEEMIPEGEVLEVGRKTECVFFFYQHAHARARQYALAQMHRGDMELSSVDKQMTDK